MIKKGFILLTIYCIVMILIGYSLNIKVDRLSIDQVNNSFFYLLKNNIKVNIYSILIGIITLGIGSIIMMTLNFTLLGASIKILTFDMSILKAANYIWAHAIFEIPSMIITTFLGVYIPYSILIWLKHKKNNFIYIEKLIILLLILTILAALVESYVTPIFIQ